MNDVSRGNKMFFQAGDCVEPYNEFDDTSITKKIKFINELATMLAYADNTSVVKVGRIAGQFAKPRSKDILNGYNERLNQLWNEMEALQKQLTEAIAVQKQAEYIYTLKQEVQFKNEQCKEIKAWIDNTMYWLTAQLCAKSGDILHGFNS